MFTKKSITHSLVAFVLGVCGAVFFIPSGGEREAAAALKPEIIFYSAPNFQGRELRLYEDSVDLPFEDLDDGTQMLWNDNIGSIIVVSGTWRLYQNGRMNTALDETPREQLDLATKAPASGWSSLVSATSRGPLQIAAPEHLGISGDISSVQLVSAMNLPDWVYTGK